MRSKILKALINDPTALFVINHSGGADSQAMYLTLKDKIPPERLVIIHAHLPGVEWDGTKEHVKETTIHELFIVEAKKTFFEMVEHRQMFPSPEYRQCTSDLKRGPINKQIIALGNQRGFTTVVNCMGLRAEESPKRARKKTFRKVKSYTNTKRAWYEYLPIHKLKKTEVFAMIEKAGQEPHWVYKAGMTRLSCCFCIMASRSDLMTAKRLKPALFAKYAETERRLNHTFSMPVKGERKFLDELV